MKKFFAIAASSLALVSCNFLDMEPEVICADTFYQSATEAQYGLNAVYGALSGSNFYGRYYGINMNMTDDLSWNISNAYTVPEVYFGHTASTGVVYNVWNRIYGGIKNANEFMDAIQQTDFDEDGSFLAQARFLRAYYHFILAQNWGDVPLRKVAAKSYQETKLAATPQYEVMDWAAKEIEACLPNLSETPEGAPTKVVRTTAYGILARIYLFMAGESVSYPADADPAALRHELYGKAMNAADAVIKSGFHSLNPSYEQIFINYESDIYDTTFRESMWEVDFVGDGSSADKNSLGFWGNVIGLRATASSNSDYGTWVVNYSAGQYKGSIKLWDLYMSTDRVPEENSLETVTDKRQDWVLPPYNYQGESPTSTHNRYPYGGDPSDVRQLQSGIDKTPYGASPSNSTLTLPLTWPGNRYIGKYRRDCSCEGNKDWQCQYTCNNFPLLRYSDVLLMYAEAANEYNGAPDEDIYLLVKQVRDRAGILTPSYNDYADLESFRELVRNERARELCCEGQRRYDLIRWGIFVNAMKQTYSAYLTDVRCAGIETYSTYAGQLADRVKEKHVLYPIPSIELGVNPLLKQNPLW